MHIRRHPAAFAATLLAVGAVGTGVAIAANAGDQDPDFNGGQAALVDFPAVFDTFDHRHDTATQVTVAPDGSIYVGGCDCGEGDSPVSLGHLDASGNPIATFGTGGVLSDGNHLLADGPTAFGFAPNGDLLVGGSSQGREIVRTRGSDDSIDGDFTIYRYDATGRFKDQAREDFDFANVFNSAPRGFMPVGDGQLVMGSAGDGGSDYRNNHFATVTLDANDAITGENVDDRTQAKAYVAGHQPAGGADGSYVIAGVGTVYTPPVNDELHASNVTEGSPYAWVLHRYNADGTRDDSYGGEFPVDGATYIDGIDGSLAGDGATYLAAYVNAPGSSGGVQIKRFTAEGQPDAAFGTQTVTSIFGDEPGPFDGPAYYVDAVAGTPDGKVIVVADHYTDFGEIETVVARLNKDGSLDTTFGDGGRRTLAPVAGANYMGGEDAAVQGDGKAVIAGDMARESQEETELRSSRAAAGLALGEQQAYVTRLAADPKPPVTTTETTPTATTTTTTTQTTTTTTTAKPVTAQSVPKACSSKRSFKIRLRIPRGDTPTSAIVKVNGKQVKVVKGSRLRSQIDLRGLPKGTVKVSITVKLAGGKKPLKGQRTYHTCIPKQGDSIPVL